MFNNKSDAIDSLMSALGTIFRSINSETDEGHMQLDHSKRKSGSGVFDFYVNSLYLLRLSYEKRVGGVKLTLEKYEGKSATGQPRILDDYFIKTNYDQCVRTLDTFVDFSKLLSGKWDNGRY